MKKLYYNHYYNLFKDSKDTENLHQLLCLFEFCPDFDFEKFKTGIFTVQNVEKYGYNFLIKNIKILTYELLKIEDEKKLNFIFEYEELKSLNYNLINQLCLDEMKKLIEFMANCDYHDILSVISNNNKSLKVIKDLLKKEDEYRRLLFFATSFEFVPNFNNVNNIIEVIYDNEFDHFMQIIDKNYLNSKYDVTYFIGRYKFVKYLLPIENKLTEKFNSYFYSQGIMINNLTELKNYYEIRNNETVNYIQNNTLEDCKEFISINYFNNNYENVKPVLENVIKIKERKVYLPYFRTSKLLTIEKKQDLLEFLEEIKERDNIFYFLVKNTKQICINDLVKTIDSNLIKEDSKIQLLDGQDFIFLLHKVKGYANNNYASKLREDPSLWNQKYDPNSYVSTTLVWEDYFSLVEGTGYILGFYPSLEDIIAMGPKDIYISSKQIKHNLNNSKAQFLLTDELKDKTVSVCNEVALRRYREKETIMPDFVFTFDEITEKDRKVAEHFNIPIYVLKSEIYANNIKKKLSSYLEEGNLDLYANRLLKMFLSFSQDINIIQKYFSLEQIEKEVELIASKYGLEKTKDIFEIYNKIIIMRNYYEENFLESPMLKTLKRG